MQDFKSNYSTTNPQKIAKLFCFIRSIPEFHGLTSNPNDLDFSWRGCHRCLKLEIGGTKNLFDVLTQYEILGFCRLGLNRRKFYRTKAWTT
jgi:hypothetical protein